MLLLKDKFPNAHIALERKSSIFLLMGHPLPLFSLFPSFQTNITILTTNICEKMLWPSSIRRPDSNPQPSELKSPPITTRPVAVNYLTNFQFLFIFGLIVFCKSLHSKCCSQTYPLLLGSCVGTVATTPDIRSSNQVIDVFQHIASLQFASDNGVRFVTR